MTHSFDSETAMPASVLDALDSFVGLYDPEQQTFRYVNRSGLEMFGVAAVSSLNEQIDFFRKAIFSTLPSEKENASSFWEKEIEYVTPSGQSFWGNTRVSWLSAGHQVGFLTQIRHLAPQRPTKGTVEYSEQRLKAVFEYAAIGIVVSDQQGTILNANMFMESIFQYTLSELIGEKVELLLPDSLRSQHVQYRQNYSAHPKVRPMGVGMALQGKRKDGSLFPVEVSLGYFYENEQVFAVAFIQDITLQVHTTQELKKQKAVMEELNASLETQVVNRTQALLETLRHLEEANNELEKALTKEKELSELKSRFVSMASHEFRTPLSTILSSATLVGKYIHTEDQPKREKHVHRIQTSVGYLTDILEEFLSVGKLEEGRIKAHFTTFHWQTFMEEVLADMRYILKEGQTILFEHKGLCDVYMDSSLLRKIIVNLISNASKFSGNTAPIFLTSHLTDTTFQIWVRDQGVGISQNDMNHLFERFFRGANVTNIQGTGLGLHIVGRYVDLMNGTVAIDSTLGEGTTITLTFQLTFPSE